MSFFYNRFDRNRPLSRLLAWLPEFLSRRRGLPMLAGTTLVVISMLITPLLLLFIVSTSDVASVWLLMCIPACLLHVAVLLGFIGFMLAIPLGQGYGD